MLHADGPLKSLQRIAGLFGIVTGYKHTWKVPSGESANMTVSRTFEVCLAASGTLLEVPNSKLNWWSAYSCYIL